MNKKHITSRGFLWAVIIASFSLAILDMIFLRDALHLLMKLDTTVSSLAAFALATVANITALMWGMINGQKLSNRKICPESRGLFIAWVLLGMVYAGIRFAYFFHPETSENNLSGQVITFIMLAISYIGTGTAIEWSAHQIWDADIDNFLKYEKSFQNEHAKIANNFSLIKESLEHLQDFSDNYTHLDIQYEKYKDAILKNEKAVMAEIVGKTIVKNPEIDPVEANKVMEEVLKERERDNEKNHASSTKRGR